MSRDFIRISYLRPLLVLLSFASPHAWAQTDRYSDLSSSAAQLATAGRFAEAVPVERQALAEAESRYGKQSVNYASSLGALGYLLMCTGDYSNAESDMTSALPILRNALGPSSLQLANPMANLTQLYMLEANNQGANPNKSAALMEKAEEYARNLLKLASDNYPADNPALAIQFEALAYVLVAERKFSDARPILERSLSIELANLGADHNQVIHTRTELGWVIASLGDRDAALDQYRKALASAEKTLGSNDPVTGTIRNQMNQAASGSSLATASATGDANSMLAAIGTMLREVVEASSTGFRSLRLQREEDFRGDTLFQAKMFPGAKKCEIWIYRDRSLGTSYRCTLGVYSSKDAAHADLAGLKQLLIATFPSWRGRDVVSGGFHLDDPSSENYVNLDLSSHSKGVYLDLDIGGQR